MKREKRGREENMTTKEYIQRQEKKARHSENSNRLIPLNEEDSGAIHYFQSDEGVYLKAVVDMQEWF
jgi:hypothetical protein